MNATVGITAHGAYIPRRRMARQSMVDQTGWFSSELAGYAKGERSWGSWDEDVITMAVEAARDCLGAAIGKDTTLSVLQLASTTAPFAERAGSAIVGAALQLPSGVRTADFSGSQRAGTSALLQALTTQSDSSVLTIASDQLISPPASTEELTSGDAAVAFQTGTQGLLAEFCGSHSVAADFVDRFRPSGSRSNYYWESRWVRDEGLLKIIPEAVARALATSGMTVDQVDHFILPLSIKNAASAVVRRLGIPASALQDSLASTVGNSGVAAPLLELSHVLDIAAPGEVIVLVAFGSGCDVIVLRRTAAVAAGPRRGVAGWVARRTEDSNYFKFLSSRGVVELYSGMRAEFDQKQSMPALWREQSSLLGLLAVRDEASGDVTFPPPAGVRSTDPGKVPHPLANRPARVTTFTADRLAFSLESPTYYGVIDFDGGGRMSAEYCDVDPDALQVGSTVRMMFRIKALDSRRGFRSYFWKAAPEIAVQSESKGE